MGQKGWHHRGYLPHLDGHEIVQHVVFRLRDSLPLDSKEVTGPSTSALAIAFFANRIARNLLLIP